MSCNRVICPCQGIEIEDIKKAVDAGAETVDDVMEATGAGTICGACIDEIAEVLSLIHI